MDLSMVSGGNADIYTALNTVLGSIRIMDPHMAPSGSLEQGHQHCAEQTTLINMVSGRKPNQEYLLATPAMAA